MDETLYKSNKQLKAEERIAIREQFLGEKKVAEITKRWEEAQVLAAGWQSVLDYAVEQFNQGKEELEKEMIKKTEEQIAERQDQIRDFLMKEKELYLENMGIQAD
jgi:squalene cyclase